MAYILPNVKNIVVLVLFTKSCREVESYIVYFSGMTLEEESGMVYPTHLSC